MMCNVQCRGNTSRPPKTMSLGGLQPAFPICKTSKLKHSYFFEELVSFSCWSWHPWIYFINKVAEFSTSSACPAAFSSIKLYHLHSFSWVRPGLWWLASWYPLGSAWADWELHSTFECWLQLPPRQTHQIRPNLCHLFSRLFCHLFSSLFFPSWVFIALLQFISPSSRGPLVAFCIHLEPFEAATAVAPKFLFVISVFLPIFFFPTTSFSPLLRLIFSYLPFFSSIPHILSHFFQFPAIFYEVTPLTTSFSCLTLVFLIIFWITLPPAFSTSRPALALFSWYPPLFSWIILPFFSSLTLFFSSPPALLGP